MSHLNGFCVYQLRVVLNGVSPFAWRCLWVPSDLPFAALHQALQTAWGWCQSQLKNPHFAAVESSSPVAVIFPHFVSLLPFPSSAMAGLGAAAVFASSPALRFSLSR